VLVAANAVEVLRNSGHTVNFYLFDDNLDPLQFRQLRVGVNKDPLLLEKFASYCGQPLACVPSPFGEHETYSQYFQKKLMKRLAALGCQPNLISSSDLYTNGIFSSYIEQIIEQELEIREYLKAEFPDYTLDRLYYPICPQCNRIESTRLTHCDSNSATIHCNNCEADLEIHRDKLQGKLSWKLDLALRWWVFKIDAEPFTKEYLEPKSGTFAVALSLARRFFGNTNVSSILVGMVIMDSTAYSPFIECLPSATLNKMFTDRWGSDLRITNERLVMEAGRTPVYEGESFLNIVKRHVPIWALDPMQQEPERFDLLQKGQRFARKYLGEELGHEPFDLAILGGASNDELVALVNVLAASFELRKAEKDYIEFDLQIRLVTDAFSSNWSGATTVLRKVLGQTRGLPGRRLLFHIPATVLETIRIASIWLLASRGVSVQSGAHILY